MEVTFIGHAGLFIETRHGSVLCDPWFNPAYFASWFPFPSNESVDLGRISNPDYLYLSHLHHDHYDPQFLREHVSKDATVLLPDFPLDTMERELRGLGFTRFIRTKNAEPVETNGLTFTIMAMVAPTDGPLGDSSLIVDDGQTRIYDQNDARPIDLETLVSLGPFDAHFLQFSGAIWYPMVYRLPDRAKQALGRKKRENGMARAFRYVESVGASVVIPSAGPPCFLDDGLFEFNDFDGHSANVFPDQTAFIEYMRENGHDNARLMIPGSIAEIETDSCRIEHPITEDEVQAIFTDKRGYLEAYKAGKQPLIDAVKATWPVGQVDIVTSLKEWFEPLIQQADMACLGVGQRILIDCETQAVVLDFQKRTVYAWDGQDCDYRFYMQPGIVESCIERHVEDWINDLFLSCRFEAERKGPFNEYVYNFFKCLSPERVQYAEGYYAELAPDQQLFECDGYRVQKRCPHLKADLTRFAEVEDGVLTCTLHGWQFELESGRCLTSDDAHLYTERIEERVEVGASPAAK